jgi:hypothetical protein
MKLSIGIEEHIKRPWVIAFVLLLIFFATVGYKYGWDDQHVEIPLLKSLINSQLYVGDYYVESLQQHFTSYFYIFLSKIISVEHIPLVYFILFCVTRYLLLYWVYKIWLHLSQSRFKAFTCVLVFMYMVRVEEFLYRTFSHQEFALAIIFAGIYFFFKERYVIASILLGLSVNFHALYSLFPFFYVGLYLVWHYKKIGFKKIGLCFLAFGALSVPFIIWVVQNKLAFHTLYTGHFKGWLNLYRYACPQNFFLPPVPWEMLTKYIGNFFELNKTYLFLGGLLILNVSFNRAFRQNTKSVFFALGSMILLFICFVGTYLYPQRLILDLNLIRNTQYLHFILIGYTSLLIIDSIDNDNIWMGLGLGTLFAFLKFYKAFVVLPAIGAIGALLLYRYWSRKEGSAGKKVGMAASGLLFAGCLFAIQYLYTHGMYKYSIMIIMLGIFILHMTFFVWFKIRGNPYNRIFVIIPLLLYFGHYCYYNVERQYQEKHEDGFWGLRRSWIDMQHYVRERTPVDAKIMVPHDIKMGGFRIHSERSVVFSERDCGIVGFDYLAALEWLKRYKAMESFRSNSVQSYHKALETGIFEYGADYVVFMRYFMPRPNNLLERVYTNMDFALYKVMRFHPLSLSEEKR